MSDLAPLVAATLKDKVVLDLMEENHSLQAENENLKQEKWRFAITGPNDGAPAYLDVNIRDENGQQINVSACEHYAWVGKYCHHKFPFDVLNDELIIHVGPSVKIISVAGSWEIKYLAFDPEQEECLFMLGDPTLGVAMAFTVGAIAQQDEITLRSRLNEPVDRDTAMRLILSSCHQEAYVKFGCIAIEKTGTLGTMVGHLFE